MLATEKKRSQNRLSTLLLASSLGSLGGHIFHCRDSEGPAARCLDSAEPRLFHRGKGAQRSNKNLWHFVASPQHKPCEDHVEWRILRIGGVWYARLSKRGLCVCCLEQGQGRANPTFSKRNRSRRSPPDSPAMIAMSVKAPLEANASSTDSRPSSVLDSRADDDMVFVKTPNNPKILSTSHSAGASRRAAYKRKEEYERPNSFPRSRAELHI